jgi:hypothetical protein
VELTLAWQAVEELTTPPSLSAKLLREDGALLAQDDRYLGIGYTPGEVRFERLVLPLYPNIPPGDYPLRLEVYHAREAGFENWSLEEGGDQMNLVTLPIRPNQSSQLTLHPLNIPFADGPILRGVDYDRTVPDTLRLYLHWQGPAHGGEVIRVMDRTARLPLLSVGDHHTALLDIPGDMSGRLYLTLTGTEDEPLQAAGPWGWPLQEVRLPDPPASARYVPLGDQMALIGVSPPGGSIAATDDPFLLHLTFLALKPLVEDYKVSVRLLDEAGQWRHMHDHQPALGAVPTLKWIRGSRVTDPHPLSIPSDIPTGVIRATAVVYENFRGTPLHPLDGRIREIPLGEWGIVRR